MITNQTIGDFKRIGSVQVHITVYASLYCLQLMNRGHLLDVAGVIDHHLTLILPGALISDGCHKRNLEQSVGPTVDNLFNSPVSEPGPTKIPSVIGTRKPNTTRLTLELDEGKFKRDQVADFFEEHTESGTTDIRNDEPVIVTTKRNLEQSVGPTVDNLFNSPVSEPGPTKIPSVIGTRKPNTTRSSAKKGGLGASKVKADFSAIVSAAERADIEKKCQIRSTDQDLEDKEKRNEERLASIRLAYKDITDGCESQDTANLKSTDSQRAKQAERLGMGKIGTGNREISHSAFANIQKIEQENSAPTHTSSLSSNLDPFFISSYSNRDRDTRNFFDSGDDNLFGGSATYGMNGGWSKNKSRDNDWDGHFSDPFNQKPNRTRDLSTVADEFPTKSPSKQPTSLSSKQSETNPDLSELMKKFANATSISSDAFFDRNDSESDGLSRFHGSSSISSDDYFGHPKVRQSQVSNELQNIKDGVKQSVTKVAGRLSNLATDVVHTLQSPPTRESSLNCKNGGKLMYSKNDNSDDGVKL
ncbi:unnamed protein product [Schistosoma guineensis]|nr:unnamed protein product [Schistosoma guineensis]